MKKIILLYSYLIMFNHELYADNYIGFDYLKTTYSENAFSKVNPKGIILKYSKEINKNFLIETQVSKGIKNDVLNINSIDIDVELNHFIGIYGVGKKYLTKNSSLSLKLGFTEAKLTAKSSNKLNKTTVTENALDFSYGVETSYYFDNYSLNFGYMKYINKKNFNFEGLNMGINFAY